LKLFGILFKIVEVFAKFLEWAFVQMSLKHHALHRIYIITMFNAF